MKNLTKAELIQQNTKLQKALIKQTKITKALMSRVKRNLKYQLNTNETFEHNSILLNQIKETKQKLLTTAEVSQRYSYLARHDTLTGLYNRNVFNNKLKKTVKSASQYSNTHALFFLDLDQFKIVNDTAGHLAGDEMLKQLSELLLGTIDSNGLLARLGGDEFGYILENCNKENAVKKTQEFLSLIDKFHFNWEDKLFRVSVSIGLVLIDNNTISHVDALRNADISCYLAKNAGRNQHHFFEKGFSDDMSNHKTEIEWLHKIKNALENGLLCLYVQPIKPLDSQEFLHYEVLIRLKDNGNIIRPDVFLPTAERHNLMTQIDYWVISNVFKWLEENVHTFHPDTLFTINISGSSLNNVSILELLTNLLSKGIVPGTRISFEVTETQAISNFATANKFIIKLKEYGCSFALDDFGSGLSSLSYLKNMHFDALKVDGSFILDILDDPLNEEMVKSINNIGHIMGLKTVAEYVATEEIYKKVIELGFDYAQGYFIGKPVPINETLN